MDNFIKGITKAFYNRLKEYFNGNIFLCMGTMPETKKEKFWYNKALYDSSRDFYTYKEQVQNKYYNLIQCLTENGIKVYYDELNNKHHIKINRLNLTHVCPKCSSTNLEVHSGMYCDRVVCKDCGHEWRE